MPFLTDSASATRSFLSYILGGRIMVNSLQNQNWNIELYTMYLQVCRWKAEGVMISDQKGKLKQRKTTKTNCVFDKIPGGAVCMTLKDK